MSGRTEKTAADGFRKFGMLDKVAYAAGDFGCNMSFALAGSFFTLFYTQYMKINSLAFAGILVILKVWDAINDPMIGGFIDSNKRNYKLGKFKTFISYGSIGLLLSASLCFLPFPNAPQMIKVMLCLMGYISWDACYTFVNVPYGSMVSVISPDPGDRAQLSAWRSLGAMCSSVPIGIILPFVLYNENQELMGNRLFFVALILGVIGFIAFRFMIKNTVERVQVSEEERKKESESFNYIKSIKNFAGNRPAIGATMIPVATFLGAYGSNTAVTVMFQSYFKNVSLSGIPTVLSLIPTLVFVPFVRQIATRWGKKEAASVGMLLSLAAMGTLMFIPIPPTNTGILMFFCLLLLNGLGSGLGGCMTYAMMADAIDYNEWKNGVREEGTTYALHSFFRKLAQGIGPSLGLVLLVAIGYDEKLGAAQTWEVASKMKSLIGACYFFSVILMIIGVRFVYNLDKNTLSEMESALGRKGAGAELLGKQMED